MTTIVKSGGKQYMVQPGDEFLVEKIDAEIGKKVTLETVKGFGDGKVECTVVEHGKGPKIDGFKYKPKNNVRKAFGHRQPYTKLKVGGAK
jgi:large subunit ribosomal protein L21